MLAIVLVHGGGGIVSGLWVVCIRDLNNNLLYIHFIKGHELLSHAMVSLWHFLLVCTFYRPYQFIFLPKRHHIVVSYFSCETNEMATKGQKDVWCLSNCVTQHVYRVHKIFKNLSKYTFIFSNVIQSTCTLVFHSDFFPHRLSSFRLG